MRPAPTSFSGLVVALSLDTLDIPPFRVLGIGGLIYAGSSLIWVAAGSHIADMGGALVTLAAYVGIMALMWLLTARPKISTDESGRHEDGYSPQVPNTDRGRGGARRSRQHHRLHRRTMQGALGSATI